MGDRRGLAGATVDPRRRFLHVAYEFDDADDPGNPYLHLEVRDQHGGYRPERAIRDYDTRYMHSTTTVPLWPVRGRAPDGAGPA